MRKTWGRVILTMILFFVVAVGFIVFMLRASLPTLNTSRGMKGLSASSYVEFDELGTPSIHAKSREDAFRVLGFVTTQDRLFQMDLVRRKMAGRLAEIMGPRLLNSDRWHRTMGFDHVAHDIFATLPSDQKNILVAYTAGVNQAMSNFKILPFEFLLLRYAPEPWRVEDSLLTILGMGTTLGWRGDKDRAITVMRATLPAKVADFLLPTTDTYTDQLLKRNLIKDAVLPVDDLVEVLQRGNPTKESHLTRYTTQRPGSNAWLVAPSKTADNRAIIANDMHLKLGVPNIWYRAELHYGETHLAGITLPGLPLVVSGSNRHIAWGFTSSGADTSDLVRIDVDSEDSSKYKTPQGSKSFIHRTEKIRIKGMADEALIVKATEWGPVLAAPLLGQPVAVRWTTLDPQATNLDFLNLDRTDTVQKALPLLNTAGAPVLNALVADADGNIGWTITGRIPIRFGTDGLQSVSWAAGKNGWNGYISPDALPRSVNPSSGFLASANQTMVGSGYPYPSVSAYDWRGNRAYRIVERLKQMQNITEKDMLALQMDSYTEFYNYYQKLAISVLDEEVIATQPELADIKRYLLAWDGHSGLNAKGLGLLVEFRAMLMDAVLSPLLAPCRQADANFKYDWPYFDVPLQRLLDAGDPKLLPNRDGYHTWSFFIRDILIRSATSLSSRYRVNNINELTWGTINRPAITHPLSPAIPLFGSLLNMPKYSLPECDECMGSTSASERLVVSPGHDDDGILVIPTGESGNPISPHYSDQHLKWVQGGEIPLWAVKPVNRLDFEPATN